MIGAAVYAERVKLLRSRLWWITLVGFTVAGLMGSLFTYIGRNPDRAEDLGIVGAKAQLRGVPTDWPGHLQLLGQIAAVGGLLLYGLLVIWMFGREFSDRTAKDLLALPTSRAAIVLAKFVVAGAWAVVLAVYLAVLGVAGGLVLGLPGWTGPVAAAALGRLVMVALLTFLLCTPFGLAASAGRGYLPAVGAMVVTVFVTQIVTALGYGTWFPWSAPALYAGISGPDGQHPVWWSPLSVAAVAAVAVVGTVSWWRHADQSQ
ncbi:ABC transporter permease [Dactylosporangium sp. CA-139066]|uniref:ABC transporter permease n=1 Tax=Dactylosporangium sp. CA-139066 TaxID=3239930 RepID=UPI003D94778E